MEYQGLHIIVENEKGTVRQGKSKKGVPWRTVMRYPYGYIANSKGLDNEELDCYIGPLRNAAFAFVVHQVDPDTKTWDEDKVMLGFRDTMDAKEAYLRQYDDPAYFGSISAVPMAELKKKIILTQKNPAKISAATALEKAVAYEQLIHASAIGIGTQVTVDGIEGRGVVLAVQGRSYTIRFREGYVIKRDITSIHTMNNNTVNKMWRDGNYHELESATEWTDLQEGTPIDRRPVEGGVVVQEGTLFCVKKEGIDNNFGCFATREEAEQRLRATIQAGGPGSGCHGPNCGRPRKPDAYTFVSPNVSEGLNSKEAWTRMHSAGQKAFEKLTKELDSKLGLQARSTPAYGVWKDGAENSLVTRFQGKADPELVRYESALRAKWGDQKAALNFHKDDNGADRVYEFFVKDNDVDKIAQQLLGHGIEFQTIEPKAGGHNVVIYDQGAQLVQNVKEAAQSFGSQVKYERGTGEFTGADTREAAKAAYNKIIARIEGSNRLLRGGGIRKGVELGSNFYNFKRANAGSRKEQVAVHAGRGIQHFGITKADKTILSKFSYEWQWGGLLSKRAQLLAKAGYLQRDGFKFKLTPKGQAAVTGKNDAHLRAEGTSEGAIKGWDTRGRGKKLPDPPTRPLKRGESTEEAWKTEDGRWEENREAWHRAIVDNFLAGRKQMSNPPEATIMGGGTAVGKTTLGKQINGDDSNMARIDSDDIKNAIPEYAELKKSDPSRAAMLVHEESSYIAKSILAEAAARGLNFTYDSTSTGGATQPLIQRLAGAGYKVNALFADIPTELARQRAADRAANPNSGTGFGRVVPDYVIENSHTGAAQNFLKVREMPELSSARLYDTTERTPRLVYQRNGTAKPIIHEPDKWDAYQKKASHYKGGSMEQIKLASAADKPKKKLEKGQYNGVDSDVFQNQKDLDEFDRLLEEAKQRNQNQKQDQQEQEPEMLAARKKVAKLKADFDGEPLVGNMAHLYHTDPQTWFHPPSLSKADHAALRVPTDDPRETNDKYLDVTKRNSNDTQEFRMGLLKHQMPTGNIPVGTAAVNLPSRVFPGMSSSARRVGIRANGPKRTFLSASRRGCL